MDLYSLGCGHCKKAKPEFETAAKTLSGHDDQALAAIDCTEFSGEEYIVSFNGLLIDWWSFRYLWPVWCEGISNIQVLPQWRGE